MWNSGGFYVCSDPDIDYLHNYKLFLSRGLAVLQQMRAVLGKVITTEQNKCRYVTQCVFTVNVCTLTICIHVETTSVSLCHMEAEATAVFPVITNIINPVVHMVQYKFIGLFQYLPVTYLLDMLAACPVFTQILSIIESLLCTWHPNLPYLQYLLGSLLLCVCVRVYRLHLQPTGIS